MLVIIINFKKIKTVKNLFWNFNLNGQNFANKNPDFYVKVEFQHMLYLHRVLFYQRMNFDIAY